MSSASRKPTRTEDITRVLRNEVLRGMYRPGERLPSERDLAVRFGSTRGVVRVALKKLEQLGIADVQPGGARVVPVCEASLDVVGHLLELQSPPNPQLVDQILEVLSALVVAAARAAVEQRSSEVLQRARGLIAEIQQGARPSAEPQLPPFAELVFEFLDNHRNPVLQIVRRGLRTRLLHHVGASLQDVQPDLRELQAATQALDAAIERGDSAATGETMHAAMCSVRRAVARSLALVGGETLRAVAL